MKPLAARILLAFGSAALASAIAYGVYDRLCREPQTVLALVDTRDRLGVLLDERARRPTRATPRFLGNPALQREVMDVATAQLFFPPAGANRPYIEAIFCANEPNLSRWISFPEHPRKGFTLKTNSLGMLNAFDVSTTPPDVRILVVGDSHGVGLCENSETFAHRVGALHRRHFPNRTVETLNASCGGYTLYNYLGVLEHYLNLEPDVFVFAVYGGNDFAPMMMMQRFYFRRPAPKFSRPDLDLVRDLKPKHIASQELLQALYFESNPEDEALAIQTADEITREIERLCRLNSIKMIAVYIPPPFRSQPRLFREQMAETLPRVGLEESDLEVSDRIADGWIAAANARGVRVIDMRPEFGSSDEFMFFHELDCHTNLAAHERIASAIVQRATTN